MTPNELRIGNWVNYKGNNVQWSCNDFGEVEHTRILEDFTKPIPLTEEWLKKFGFEKNEDNKWIKDGFFCYLVYGGGNGWKTWVNLRKDDFTLALVGQVHQLQNLYFALTGKEIEAND